MSAGRLLEWRRIEVVDPDVAAVLRGKSGPERREGGSERHLRDIAGIMRISGSEADPGYIEEWARRLDLGDIWDAIQRRLGER